MVGFGQTPTAVYFRFRDIHSILTERTVATAGEFRFWKDSHLLAFTWFVVSLPCANAL